MLDVIMNMDVFNNYIEDINRVRNSIIKGYDMNFKEVNLSDVTKSLQEASTILDSLNESCRELFCVLNIYTVNPHETAYHILGKRYTIETPTLNDSATDRKYTRSKYKHYIISYEDQEGDIYRNPELEKAYCNQIDQIHQDLRYLFYKVFDTMAYIELYIDEHKNVLSNDKLLAAYIEYMGYNKSGHTSEEMVGRMLNHMVRTYSCIKSTSLRKKVRNNAKRGTDNRNRRK